jgi:metal-dependent hydrolase (beta-lactamase superfamily II)
MSLMWPVSCDCLHGPDADDCRWCRSSEPLIRPTVEALRGIAPKLIVLSHCTGWEGDSQNRSRLPDAYVPNSVGTTFLI